MRSRIETHLLELLSLDAYSEVAGWLEIRALFSRGQARTATGECSAGPWSASQCLALPLPGVQALKANPQGAPKELSLKSNYVTKFGQVLRMLRVLRCAVGAVTWGSPAVEA